MPSDVEDAHPKPRRTVQKLSIKDVAEEGASFHNALQKGQQGTFNAQACIFAS